MRYVYPAVFCADSGKVAVNVPDIPGCATFGDDMNDAMVMASDAAAMLLADSEDKGEEIPCASAPSSIKAEGIISLIVADTDEWRQGRDLFRKKKTIAIGGVYGRKRRRVRGVRNKVSSRGI